MRPWMIAFAVVLAGLAGVGRAQQPSQSQISAIRSSCRGDYQRNCAAVPTGGAAALSCLRAHAATLTPACGRAVAAVGGVPATPARQSPAAQTPAADSQAADAHAGDPHTGDPHTGDPHWPHVYAGPNGTVTVYEPQVISWPGHATLNARAAVAVAQPATAKPVLGTVEVSLATQTDMATRTVSLSDPKLLSSRFPTLDTTQAAAMQQWLSESLPRIETKTIPLDTVLLGLKEGTAPQAVLDNSPPAILHSDRPAALLLFDGAPVLSPIPDTGLQVAVNANQDVVFDRAGGGTWYLLIDGAWYSAPDHAGPYAPAGALPADFARLPPGTAFDEIRKNIPGRRLTPGQAPTILVSDQPAELIETKGAPVFAPLPGTTLQRATNTGSTLLRDSLGRLYYLTSGRWFSAAGLDGPWTFATPALPADFAAIPANGPDGAVLASVPGTVEAQTAVLGARVPHQATLRRATAHFEAHYTGAPQFKPIGATGISYAVNSPDVVLEADGKYFACYQAAWFVAATPTGPWVLADLIPPAIATIPPSSPVYPVTHVQVYASTAEAVTYGYTAGYALGFVTSGVLVYGTGYYYPPVVYPGPVPVYYGYPHTYAGASYYNPATGAWARGGAVYGAYGGAAAGWAYNPATGAYAHGSATWNNGYGTAYASFGNPTTGRSGSTTQNWNPYGRWGSSTVSGPNQTVNTASGRNSRGAAAGFQSSTGAQGAGVHGAGGRNAGVVRGANGDVYAGADGNVYRHTSDGWSKWSNGGWQGTQRSTSGTAQLDQDRTARNWGQGGAARGRGRFR